MKTAGGEIRCRAPFARVSWFVWFGLTFIVSFSFSCRSNGSHDSTIVPAGGVSGSTTEVPHLVNLNGRSLNPFEATDAKAIVFIFVRTDCPISNRYAPEIQRLLMKYQARGIDFWLVYPDPETEPAEIVEHVKEFQLSLRVLRDLRHGLVNRSGVQVTPEAAVFLRDGRVVYRGRIDDKFADFGKERPSPSRHDLEEALISILNGNPIMNSTSVAIGCYIPALP